MVTTFITYMFIHAIIYDALEIYLKPIVAKTDDLTIQEIYRCKNFRALIFPITDFYLVLIIFNWIVTRFDMARPFEAHSSTLKYLKEIDDKLDENQWNYDKNKHKCYKTLIQMIEKIHPISWHRNFEMFCQNKSSKLNEIKIGDGFKTFIGTFHYGYYLNFNKTGMRFYDDTKESDRVEMKKLEKEYADKGRVPLLKSEVQFIALYRLIDIDPLAKECWDEILQHIYEEYQTKQLKNKDIKKLN